MAWERTLAGACGQARRASCVSGWPHRPLNIRMMTEKGRGL